MYEKNVRIVRSKTSERGAVVLKVNERRMEYKRNFRRDMISNDITSKGFGERFLAVREQDFRTCPG